MNKPNSLPTQRCKDCDDCARHAYSDATTPGFFHSKCEKHRLPTVKAETATTPQAERTIKVSEFFSEFRKLGGNMKHNANTSHDVSAVLPFMSSGAGPYVYAADYFLLLVEFNKLKLPKERNDDNPK